MTVKPHLAAYLYVRFRQCVISGTIQLPSSSTLYAILGNLTVKRPKNVSWRETGNLTFALPAPRYGKSPETYNYLGEESKAFIECEIDTLMKMDLYSFLLHEKIQHGRMYSKSLQSFMTRYHIDDANESALTKAFQRWLKRRKEERKKEE